MLAMSPSGKSFTSLTSTIGSRRILLAAPAHVKERVLKSTSDRKDFKMFKYWNRKYRDTKYIVETDESKIDGIMSKYDEKMPILDLNNILFFKTNSNCPLAGVYDVMKIPYARLTTFRPGDSSSVCPTLKISCCAVGTFRSFMVDSKIARLSLKAFYKNKYRLNMFLLSGLVDNFKLLPDDDYNEQCQGAQDRSKCQALMLNIVSAINLAKKHLKHYKEGWSQCKSSIEEFRNGFRCAACDPTNNKWIDHESKKIIIHREEVSIIIGKCYDMSLYEQKIQRGVYVAFLNYARHVIPTLSISSNIIWELFPPNINKCAKWVEYAQANNKTDFTKSKDCTKYAFKILVSTIEKPSKVSFRSQDIDYFENVIGALINKAALEQLATILPDINRKPKDLY
jgi:hypothetical protein